MVRWLPGVFLVPKSFPFYQILDCVAYPLVVKNLFYLPQGFLCFLVEFDGFLLLWLIIRRFEQADMEYRMYSHGLKKSQFECDWP